MIPVPHPPKSRPIAPWHRLGAALLRLGRRCLVPSRFYTVLILPHSAQRFRKLHFSQGFFVALVFVGTFVLAAGLTAPQLVIRLRGQSAELTRVALENSRLRAERERVESTLSELASRLSLFEGQVGVLARELDVSGLPAAQAASGGAPEELADVPLRSWFDDETKSLRLRTEALAGSLEQLDSAFSERSRVLAATPNGLPVPGWFSHGYGWRKDPFTGEREFHRGVDIVADLGTDVLAPADGIAARAGRLAAYGKSIDLAHGYGFVTRYGHLSEILIRPGQRIRRGEVIGRVGSTGRSTGPHLHYEVFRDGRRVNPWNYMGQKGP